MTACAAFAAGCQPATTATHEESAPIAVTTAVARQADLPAAFEAGGIVRARHTALVASRLMAPVTAVHVRAGDRVRQGARLVTLEGREIAANEARAAATLAGSAETVASAEGALRSAEAALALARATRTRMETLHEKRSATTDERDRAVAAFEAAEGQVQSARASLAAAVATRQAASAGRDAASVVASYTILTAPFDGIVTERRVDPGDMATPGLPLLILEDASAFRLEVTMDEARAAAIQPGQDADVSLDDAGGRTWVKAKIAEVARVDPLAHSFTIKLDLPAEVASRSGVFGRARFAGPVRRTLVVPASATIRRGQLTFVFAIDGEGRARLQPISPGAAGDAGMEVLAGLDDGARVVSAPPPALVDGQRVREEQR